VPIGAGKLDRRIDLLRPIETTDEVGGASVTWERVSTVWASRKDISGRELFRSGVAADFRRRYVIRDPGYPIDARWRLRDPEIDGGDFELAHIARLERRGEGYELLVRDVDQTGVVGP
jgi:head-tail adaptor